MYEETHTQLAKQERNDHIRRLRATGASLQDIANDFGLSKQRIGQICDAAPTSPANKKRMPPVRDSFEALRPDTSVPEQDGDPTEEYYALGNTPKVRQSLVRRLPTASAEEFVALTRYYYVLSNWDGPDEPHGPNIGMCDALWAEAERRGKPRLYLSVCDYLCDKDVIEINPTPDDFNAIKRLLKLKSFKLSDYRRDYYHPAIRRANAAISRLSTMSGNFVEGIQQTDILSNEEAK